MLYFEVSAKTGKNVDNVFEEIAKNVFASIESNTIDFSNEVK